MTLHELLREIGDENLTFQTLPQSMTNITTNKKGISRVTFETDAITANDAVFGGKENSKVGWVVWMPKAKLEEVLKREQEATFK